jgi:sec-independent protein translocase protein TatA
MPTLGGWEIVIILGVLVLLFGAKRLPDMARSIGQSARVFKGEMRGMKNDAPKDEQADAAPAAPQQQAAPAQLPTNGSAPVADTTAPKPAAEPTRTPGSSAGQ